MSCRCSEIDAIVDRKLRPIMQFLELAHGRSPQVRVKPEELIKQAGGTVYAEEQPGEVTASSLKGLLAAIAAALFYRGGYHRFPAEVTELTAENDDGTPIVIEDAMGLLEWMIRELDGVLGKFPLDIQAEVEEDQEDGSTVTSVKEMKLPNLAETLRELVGLLLSIADDASAAADFSLRGMLEAGKAEIAALIAQDYAKANAQFLGYRGNPVVRKVKFPYDPGTPDSPAEEDNSGAGSPDDQGSQASTPEGSR